MIAIHVCRKSRNTFGWTYLANKEQNWKPHLFKTGLKLCPKCFIDHIYTIIESNNLPLLQQYWWSCSTRCQCYFCLDTRVLRRRWKCCCIAAGTLLTDIHSQHFNISTWCFVDFTTETSVESQRNLWFEFDWLCKIWYGYSVSSKFRQNIKTQPIL